MDRNFNLEQQYVSCHNTVLFILKDICPISPAMPFVVQLLSCVRLFATPWTAAPQASLSLIISQSSPEFIESVMMPSNHLIFCHPLFLSSVFPSIRVFSNELLLTASGSFRMSRSSHQVAKVLELQHQSFQRIFKVDFIQD